MSRPTTTIVMTILHSLGQFLCYVERDGKRRWSTTKVETWVALTAAVVLFTVTAGVQSTEHHLTTFVLALATIVPLSVLMRVATEDLTLRCQHHRWEVAAALTRALLGYQFPPPIRQSPLTVGATGMRLRCALPSWRCGISRRWWRKPP